MSRGERNLTEVEWAEMTKARRPGIPQRSIATEILKRGDKMNKWEREYSWELEARKRAGEILWWGYEAIKLRLADATYYTPDFAVIEWRLCPLKAIQEATQIHASRLHFIEVKGFLRDDANVKFKMAGEIFPFEFFMYRKRKQAEGGGWELMKHLNGGRAGEPIIDNVSAPPELCGHESFCRQVTERMTGWHHCNATCPQLHIPESRP